MRIVNLLATRWTLLLLAAVGLAAAGGILAWQFTSDPGSIHLDTATDVSDDRRLAGIADNVFIGRVEAEVGRTRESGIPYRHFRVAVMESLKGSLSAQVTINDDGSTLRNNGVWIFEDALVLPKVGRSYLFATRLRQENNTHTVVSGGYGRIEIDGSESQNALEVLESDPAGVLKRRFAEAVENEIPFATGS